MFPNVVFKFYILLKRQKGLNAIKGSKGFKRFKRLKLVVKVAKVQTIINSKNIHTFNSDFTDIDLCDIFTD